MRSIQRGALLTDYAGRYGDLLAEVERVAAEGYRAVELFPPHGVEEMVRRICARAEELGLEVWMITSYMKDQQAYLAEHPAQKLVLAADLADQDGLSTSTWGCPFQPEFKARQRTFLEDLARMPAMRSMNINDEAFLASGCYCPFCRSEYRALFGGEPPLLIEPTAEDFASPSFRRFLRWRMERWNAVHAELADAIRAANPLVRVFFQTSPIAEFWFNPWWSGVDLSRMIEGLDGVSTDPYYTFHDRHFDPAEAYLSEWCRLLAGIAGTDKTAAVYPQGFSHATFTRPLDREDGVWAALVPPACGVDRITPYNYRLMRATPAAASYEAMRKLDPWFERARPLEYAAVVHSVQTEIYCRPLPACLPDLNYDARCVMPVTEALRNLGLPYTYLPDARLTDLGGSCRPSVLVLSDVAALSDAQAAALEAYFHAGGNAVIFGGLGACDADGGARPVSLLEKWFGVVSDGTLAGNHVLPFPEAHALAGWCETYDWEGARHYSAGAATPQTALRDPLRARLPVEPVAAFVDGSPAVAVLPSSGRVVWFAGFPSRTTEHPRFGTRVLNRMMGLAGSAVRWAAGGPPELRVEGWPPATPLRALRPFDQRLCNTLEFFASRGPGLRLGLVASYGKESAAFSMTLQLAPGESLARVCDLISGEEFHPVLSGREASVSLAFNEHTPARLVAWQT